MGSGRGNNVEPKWPDPPKFDVKYDVYGRGEPRVVLYEAGTMTVGETMPLSEAERRAVVSKEQAQHARQINERIREAVERASKPREESR